MLRRKTADFGPTDSTPMLAGPGRDRPPRILWGVAAFALVTAGMLAMTLAWFRTEALRSGGELTQALAHVIAEQTTRSLGAVDVRMQLAAHELREMEAAGPLDEERVRERLRHSLEGVPFVRNLWVVDPKGTILFWSMAGHADFSVADREYFRAHVDHPQSGFYVGRVVRSRVTREGIMVVSRAVRGPDGRVQRVMAAAIEPPHIQAEWRELDLATNGVIALFHTSGQAMMRSPPMPQALGLDFSNLPLFTHYLPSGPAGSFRNHGVLDGVERLYAWRVLPAYPELVVLAGSPVAQLLADWRRFAWLTGGLWSLAVLAATILGRQLQRQAQRRRRMERRFGELAQAMPQIVFITNAAGTVEFVNERWFEATGRPVASVLGAPWEELAHPEDSRRVAQERAAGVPEGQPVQVEMRLRYRDGSDRWQLVRAVPNRNEHGELVSWYGTATDVHDLKVAQEQLQRQADILRMTANLARLGSWTFDVASRTLSWSDEAAAILDFPPDRRAGLDELIAGLDERDRGPFEAAVRRTLEDGLPFDAEFRMTTPRGRRVYVHSVGRPVRDAAGAVVRVEGATQDIAPLMDLVEQVRELNATLEQRIEQRTRELQQQEALFRTLASEAPLPIWTVDPQGHLTFISRAWYDLVGGAPPEWLGDDWQKLVHPDDMAASTQEWARCRREGRAFRGTRRIRARDGTYHTTTYQASPVRGDDGRIAFWVGVDTDITDLMAQETALRLANEQLEAYSYSVSHDLQSPLQRIGAFAQLLQQELAGQEGTRAGHFLRRIRANVEEMVQLVQGLLSLARVTQAELVRGRIDLSSLATEILQRLKADAPDRQVHWQVEPGLHVTGDVRLMRSVMENLLGNAWKFTSGTPEARIVVGGCVARGEFFVRDNGAGFDMAHAGKLFGPFQRLHRQDEFPGTGVGLATVARAIARHGGRVWGEGEPGRGATLWFTMPVPG